MHATHKKISRPATLRIWAASLAAAMLLHAPLAPATGNRITLNFVNAEITAVVQAMGEMTGKTFVVDPRVKGTLHITSPRPVTPAVAYEIVLAALRMQGYAALQSDGVVRIVPEADAKFYANPVLGKGKPTGEVVTRVFILKHESATQMLPALRPLVGANSVMNADGGTNALIVTDYANNLDRLARIIENLDLPRVDEPVLIPLKYAAAQDVANLIGKLFTGTSTGAPGPAIQEVDRLDVAVDSRSNSLILRGRDRSLVSRAQNMIVALDTPTPVAGNVHVVYLKNAEASKVAETLRKILSADSSAITQTTAPSAGQTPRPATGSAPAATDGPGMVQADTASNALIITAPEAIFRNLHSVVEKLDVRRAQVLVEALIAEVSADKAAEFGTQWLMPGGSANNSGVQGVSLFGPSGDSNFLSAAATAAASQNPSALAGVLQGFSVGLLHRSGNGDIDLGILARALESQVNANILATPTLMTLDNEESKISVGTNVPFTTGSYSLSGNTASPFQTIERRDVGLVLKVKPLITEGGTVRLQIYQELSKLRKVTEVNLTDVATDKRSIDSTVLVDDGQIIVLGGLIQDQVEDVEDRVPFLGDIPILGHLFRYNTRKHSKNNLMVFLRPVIVRNGTDAATVTNPRYGYILEQQKASAPPHKTMMPDVEPPMLKYDLGLAPPIAP